MICKVCDKETRIVCICGFCPDCIRENGHDKCAEIAKEKNEKSNTNHSYD